MDCQVFEKSFLLQDPKVTLQQYELKVLVHVSLLLEGARRPGETPLHRAQRAETTQLTRYRGTSAIRTLRLEGRSVGIFVI